jgi:predicted transcriptional regulator
LFFVNGRGLKKKKMENKKEKKFSAMDDEPFIDFLVEKFGKIDKKFEQVDERFERVDEKFEQIDKRLEKLEGRVGNVENQMVTKSFMTDKLADLEGTLIGKVRKQDSKVNLLVDILLDKKVLNTQDLKQLKEIEVFPSIKQ